MSQEPLEFTDPVQLHEADTAETPTTDEGGAPAGDTPAPEPGE